jgi:hypothetical protein
MRRQLFLARVLLREQIGLQFVDLSNLKAFVAGYSVGVGRASLSIYSPPRMRFVNELVFRSLLVWRSILLECGDRQ